MAKIVNTEVDVHVVSIPRNADRQQVMTWKFPQEKLVFIDGHDGAEWSDFVPSEEIPPVGMGENHRGIPLFACQDESVKERMRKSWLPGKQQDLQLEGIIGPTEFQYWLLSPGEVGCAMSHREAWMRFLCSGSEWGVFLEDDTMPGSRLGDSTIWDEVVSQLGGRDADHVVLWEDRTNLKVNESNEVIRFAAATSYALSRKGAVDALDVCFPMHAPLDVQWYWALFNTYTLELGTLPIPRRGELPALAVEGVVALDEAVNSKSSIWMNDKR